jgi:hypothetical protein
MFNKWPKRQQKIVYVHHFIGIIQYNRNAVKKHFIEGKKKAT